MSSLFVCLAHHMPRLSGEVARVRLSPLLAKLLGTLSIYSLNLKYGKLAFYRSISSKIYATLDNRPGLCNFVLKFSEFIILRVERCFNDLD